MKKYRIFATIVGILAVIVASLVGCEKNEMLSDNAPQSINVGQSHNDGLDYICKSLNFPTNKSTDSLLDNVGRCANSFLMEKFENDINAQLISIQSSESAISNIRSNYQELGHANIEVVWFSNNSNELSEKQKELLSILAEALDSNNLQTVLTACQIVKYRVTNECSEEEKVIMNCAIDICIASSQYWSENIDKWIQLLGIQGNRWFNWGSLPKSDIAGGIGGAVAGAIVGAGAGAVPGALGGAVSTSAADAIYQILNHFF